MRVHCVLKALLEHNATIPGCTHTHTHTTLPLPHFPMSTAADYRCCTDVTDVDYRCVFTCECSFPDWLVGRSLWQVTPAEHQYLWPMEKQNQWQLATWQCHVYPCRTKMSNAHRLGIFVWCDSNANTQCTDLSHSILNTTIRGNLEISRLPIHIQPALEQVVKCYMMIKKKRKVYIVYIPAGQW